MIVRRLGLVLLLLAVLLPLEPLGRWDAALPGLALAAEGPPTDKLDGAPGPASGGGDAAHKSQPGQAQAADLTEASSAHAATLGEELPLWSAIPFVGILLSIALFPLLAPRFWHHHFGKVAAFWALLFALPFALAYGWHQAAHSLLHILVLDYVPFIILLAGLYVIAGGIAVQGSLAGTPGVNTALLLIGTLLASWIGTTGASMLMIRPLLRSNSNRRNRAHLVIFFIFLVSNIGGALTPIGDPPLFLGFLHGVKFFWTLACLPAMAFNAGILLVLFYIIDAALLKRENLAPQQIEREAVLMRIEGSFNFLLLGGVVGAVILSGVFNHHPVFYNDVTHQVHGITMMGGDHPLTLPWLSLLRDGAIILLLLASWKLTRQSTRELNHYNWFPIQEVGFLFAGIFVTIIPALEILKAGTHGAMAFIIERVSTDASYFWITGLLSSFLDNAPTYLTFFNTALGSRYPGMAEAQAVPLLMEHGTTLLAISLGAVFMGANTYIGNAPNFMVKSIAEQSGVKMPSFFGYMAWSGGLLIPLFLLNTWIFF
jgi:Na+/H+ antiporter NhaD/arsenite permease-like protein